MANPTSPKLDRNILGKFLPNQQAIKAFEKLQENVTDNASEIANALAKAVEAGALATSANAAAVSASNAADVANANALSATGSANAASSLANDANINASTAEALAQQLSEMLGTASALLDELASAPPAQVVGTIAMQNSDFVSIGQFGANGKDPQGSYSIGGPATDLASVIALANNIRLALIANGIAI